MKIDLERFLALTTMLAAPLVTANGCILNTGSDDDEDSGATATEGDDSADDGTVTAASTDTTGGTTSADDGGTDTTGTETSAGTEGDTTEGTDDAADTTGGGNPLGNCCEAQEGTGCEVAEVEECVCLEDPYCCETQWDINCVQEVNAFGCGECELPPQVWDCSCVTDCDGTPVDTVWQVCAGDDIEAAGLGQAACEMELDAACDVFVCDECSCFTSEVPEIDCG